MKINLLVTLDENYIPYLNVMLSSALHSNPDCQFDVYVLHNSITEPRFQSTKDVLGMSNRLIPIRVEDDALSDAPTTARYPRAIYYRIFAARFLPQTLDRVLYLDPDIVVNGSLKELYQMEMGDYFYAAASHIGPFLQKINELRLDMGEDNLYINSGVMLINLELLRKEQKIEEVFAFIEKRKNLLVLPDQDIISSLYGSRILALNAFRYNMTELLYLKHSPFEARLTLDWVRQNSIVIHYCGRNKPWNNNYVGQLNVFYQEAAERMNQIREGCGDPGHIPADRRTSCSNPRGCH